MASAFGHVAVAYALGKSFRLPLPAWRVWSLTIFCSLLPDIDVVGFFFGIPYGNMWGHRGFTHSITFAMIVGLVLPRMAFPAHLSGTGLYWICALYFFLVTLSHGILDALTNGGLGIAFLAPFDATRYFFPWRPIAVSPIGITQFFSESGINVLLNELLWIGVPVGIWLVGLHAMRRRNRYG